MSYVKKSVVLFGSLLILASIVGAQTIDEETGCEKYSDHWLCPQTILVSNILLEYTNDLQCYELENESYGCYGTAVLVSDAPYRECWLYLPLLPGNEVDYDRMQYDYDCKDKKWDKGSQVELLTFPDLIQGAKCVEKEGDETYSIQTCQVKGQRIMANATISEENGTKYLIVIESKPHTAFILEPWHWIVIVVVILIVLWVYKKRKEMLPTS